MIRFSLKCALEHSFESWFQSGAAFDKVKAAGMVTCPQCGTAEVEKTLMAPRVQTARKAAPAIETDQPSELTTAVQEGAVQKPTDNAPPQVTAEMKAEMAAKIQELKAHVEATSDYVGEDFVKEARAMHDGDAPERAIYGEANLQEAQELIEEGVPVAPLPFIPVRKTN